MSSARRIGRSRERGFVLVGVVIIVLALTILGLSLYSVSGYDGQFLAQSYEEAQLEYRASAAHEIAKALMGTRLGSPPAYRLDSVVGALGREGIVFVNAWQQGATGPVSTGPVLSDRPVHLEVTVQKGTLTRSLNALYTPSFHRNPYEQLITSSGYVVCPTADSGGISRVRTVSLEDDVWQTVRAAGDTVWKYNVLWPRGKIWADDAPSPDCGSFFSARLGAADTANYYDRIQNRHHIRFDAGTSANAVRYFKGPSSWLPAITDPAVSSFDFLVQKMTFLEVRGTNIWMIPAGVRFDSLVVVNSEGFASSAPVNTLVIVAGPNGRYFAPPSNADGRDIGIWFRRGLFIDPAVNVFLVSSGSVYIEDHAGTTDSDLIHARNLTVFSNGVFMMGPKNSSLQTMSLEHPTTMDPVGLDLLNLGRVPVPIGIGSDQFTLVPGSWHEQ